jgi:flagellar motor switch protein FliG
MTTAATLQTGAGANRKLTGAEKVATLLLAVDREVAARLMRHFSPEQTRQLARAAAELGTIPKPVLEGLLEAFLDSLARGADIEGSADDAARLLAGILPSEQVEELMTDIKGKAGRIVWSRLGNIPPTVLAQYLAKEHPQVAALVLSRTTPNCAAAVLGQFPSGLRNEVVRRMLSVKRVQEPSMIVLESVLHDELLFKATQSTGPDIHARLAALLNKMERNHMDDVLNNLAEMRPKEAKLVRGLLFTFDDIAKLTPEARAKLLEQVPMERVIVAVKGTGPELLELILSALGGRARRMIEQELASGATAPAKEVAKARREIADLALVLAEKGLIELKPEEE